MRAFLLVLTGLIVVGCARSNGAGGPDGEDAVESSDLAASLEVNVSDDGVRLVLHATNTTTRPMELTFPTSQRYDFVVANASGEELWRWSDGMAFLQALSSATLAPGESWDMEAVWDPGAAAGPLVATGWLTARSHALRQSAAFELP